ncbi:MAG: hypothetical protein MJ085_00340 [Clostridia bacterium]|nr:hypothetical protein [Clostridia bacterium]
MRRMYRVDEAFEAQQKNRQEVKQELPDPKSEAPAPSVKDEMEKGDLFAMLVSAWFLIVPLCLILLLVIAYGTAFLLGLL